MAGAEVLGRSLAELQHTRDRIRQIYLPSDESLTLSPSKYDSFGLIVELA